jgi:hypothetical protein
VVATLETKNLCIAEDFAEEIGLSYGQYVNHRVSKGVTEQYEDLLAPKPDVFRNGSIASVWPSADDFRSSLEADTVTAGRHVSKVP